MPSPLLKILSTTEFEIEFSKYLNGYWKLIQSLTHFDPLLGMGDSGKQGRYDPFLHGVYNLARVAIADQIIINNNFSTQRIYNEIII